MKLVATSVLVLAMAVLAPAVQAQDLAAGKAVWDRLNCASCHGADAIKGIDPAYPILAGQRADYLAHALSAYQRGVRGLPASANVRKNAIMGAFASQLTKQEIKNVSAWLASLPSPLSAKK